MTRWLLHIIGGVLGIAVLSLSLTLTLSQHLPERASILAFVGYDSSYAQIRLLHRQRGWVHDLTAGHAGNYHPHWSPDGGSLVFSSNRDGNRELYVIDHTGSDPRRLTHHDAIDDMPVWSPDGGRIAFTSTRSGNRDIFVMRADGSQQHNLTLHPASDTNPHWLPNGRLAFLSDRDGSYHIYTINAQGCTVQRLTDGAFNYLNAVWSPDGRWLAFTSGSGDSTEIIVMDLTTGGLRQLTANNALDVPVGWLPDAGSPHLIFHSRRSGERVVYVMAVDGGAVRRIADGGLLGNQFAWYPSAAP